MRQDSGVCNTCGFFIHAVVLGLTSLVLCLIVILIMPISTLIASEGCVYINTESGTAKSDHLMNMFIEQKWPSVVAELTQSLGNAEFTQYVNLPAPKNALRAATGLCKPAVSTERSSQFGLLHALGWTSIIDSNKLVDSDLVAGQVAKGEK